MISRRIVLIGGVMLFAFAGAALYLTSIGPVSANSVEVQVTLTEGGNGTSRFWQPSSITVRQGQTITLVVRNADDEDNHALAIDILSVNTGAIPPGASARVTFEATQVGRFRFYDPL